MHCAGAGGLGSAGGWFVAGLVIGAAASSLAIAVGLYRRRLLREPLAGGEQPSTDRPLLVTRHGRAA